MSSGISTETLQPIIPLCPWQREDPAVCRHSYHLGGVCRSCRETVVRDCCSSVSGFLTNSLSVHCRITANCMDVDVCQSCSTGTSHCTMPRRMMRLQRPKRSVVLPQALIVAIAATPATTSSFPSPPYVLAASQCNDIRDNGDRKVTVYRVC